MDTNIKSSPKDVFLHLLSIGTLYYVAVQFITLIWQYINIYFPDPLEPEYFTNYAGLIRFAMASLLIVYPVHCYVMWLLYGDYAAHPEHRELRIRKWLVHFTLFVAAIVMTGDLVTLVYNFLGGELTARFVLKVLTVLVVAGMIFIFYLRDLKNKWALKGIRALVLAVIVAMLVAIVGGFFTAGSPFKARLYRFDEQRVNDLQMLQGQIINYWQSKGKLPSTLADLEDSISGFRVPVDPMTQSAYEYHVMIGQERPGDTLKFELCANFSLPFGSQTVSRMGKFVPMDGPYGPYGPYGANWEHDAGRVCFTRDIDPELYPKFEKSRP